MRLCLVTRPDLEPATHGAAVKILHTAQALVRQGVQVSIVTNDRVWLYKTEGDRLVRARYPQALLSATNVPPRLKAQLARLKLPTYWHGLRGALDAIGYPRDEHFLYQPLVDADFLARVLYVGWAHHIDVFQAEFPGYAAPVVAAARLLGKRSVLAEHNVEWQRLAATTGLGETALRRIRDIELGLCARVDRVVTCSEEDRRILADHDVQADRIAVIPHGVELAPYDPLLMGPERRRCREQVRARYHLPQDKPLLVFHGTLHYWPNTVAIKRLAEEILPRLEARGLDVRVMICGMNPPRYYAHPSIVFTGMVQDLPEHLSAADLAVVPLEDGGGTRLKILEYFAAGLPVVSTAKGAEGIPSRDGVELLLRDGFDAFADGVAALLADAARRDALARAGRRFVEAYGWDAIATRWRELYDDKPLSPFRLPDVLPAAPTPRPEHTRPLPTDPLQAVTSHLPMPVTPTKPPTMIMMINRGCNLRCSFCDLYERPKLFPEADAVRILDDAARLGVRTVVFTGGEPMLHPALFRLIRHAKDLGLGTNVTTNGTYIERHLDKILASGLDSISVSVDGVKETHEALRGVDGCWDETMRGLDLLQQAGGPHINLYFVVTGKNVGELQEIWSLARRRGFGFDFWPVNGSHQDYLLSDGARASYRQVIHELAAADADVRSKQDYYLSGLDYHAGWDKRVRCLGLIEQFGVNLEGEMTPCCVWEARDLKVGDLRGEGARSLPELWYGPEAEARRRQIFEEGCHNRCFNHSLYEFRQATGASFVVGEGALTAPPPTLSAPTLSPPAPPPRPAPPPLPADAPPHLPGSYLVLELANGCNLKCVHCAQAEPGHPHYAKTGFFPRSAVRELLEDLTRTGGRFDTLILFWLGEPLLHPEFGAIYEELLDHLEALPPERRPFGKVEVHTNAILLTPALSRRILNDRDVPQRWHFTLDAHDPQTYRDIKGADQLARVKENVEAFYRLKGERRARWPNTALQYIVSERNAAEAGAFVAAWEDVLGRAGLAAGRVAGHVPEAFERDYVFLRSLDCPTPEAQRAANAVYRRVLKAQGLEGPKAAPSRKRAAPTLNLTPCSGFWKSPVIGWDGMLTTCTRDNHGMNRLGNVLTAPFSELWWGGERIRAWRDGVAKGDYGDRVLCKGCFIPQSVNYTDIEPAEITRAQAWAHDHPPPGPSAGAQP